MLDNWLRRLVQRPKKLLGEYVREGDTVFDVGCGPGFFTIDLAKMVGDTGKVVAIDLQDKMLRRVRKKAEKHGVSGRMAYHRCEPDRIGLKRQANFVLAFYMVHETPDPPAFLREVKGLLKPGGKMLAVEPKMHVSKSSFAAMLAEAEAAGLTAVEFPEGKGGRSVVLVNSTPG
jgi:ubiquinone/menaquinone biosynthesis C-methylase UbiE